MWHGLMERQLHCSLRSTVSRAGAVAITLVVGASRLYLGAHWLTDVLAGYALGAAWIAFVAAISLLAMDQGRRPATLPTTGLSRRSGPGGAPKRDRMAQYG